MVAYIVATVRISDPQRFAAYGAAIKGLSERFGGEPIVRGPVSALLEGIPPADDRVVVTRFPDAHAARAYIESLEYQEAAAIRLGAAEVTTRLIDVPS